MSPRHAIRYWPVSKRINKVSAPRDDKTLIQSIGPLSFVEDAKSEAAVFDFIGAAESGPPLPLLYATLKRDFHVHDDEARVVKLLRAGQRVRINDVVRRSGAVCVTSNLADAEDVEIWAAWKDMTNYSDKP